MSAALARRVALAAQGFAAARPVSPGRRALGAMIDRLGLLQIDSVNVFERSHYLPGLARLGRYDTAVLDDMLLSGTGPYVEYWAHEAAFIPREAWPLFGWRMREYRERYRRGGEGWVAAHAELVERLRRRLADQGPSLVRELEDPRMRSRAGWWDWSDTKRAVEYLLATGEVAPAGRLRFERRYALAEQVLGEELARREVPQAEAIRELIRRSAAALGVGTLADLADYYRIGRAPAARAVAQLEAEGELVPVAVEGWADQRGRPLPAWLHRSARRPRRIEASALLSPFDPVVWFRPRTERMFGFRYRIEIYTPAHRRVHGYYVLPVLLGERLAGRVDLKSDRSAGALVVRSAWVEAGEDPDAVAAALWELLQEAALWRGLTEIRLGDPGALHGEGDLMPALRATAGLPARG